MFLAMTDPDTEGRAEGDRESERQGERFMSRLTIESGGGGERERTVETVNWIFSFRMATAHS